MLGLSLEKIDNQEGLLDGDFFGSLLGVFLGVIIGISVVKLDDDKVGFLTWKNDWNSTKHRTW